MADTPTAGEADARLLASVRKLTEAAARGVESYGLAELVAEEVVALLGAAASAVFRYEEQGIVMIGGHAVPGERIFTRGMRLARDQLGITGEVEATGRAVRFDNYHARAGEGAQRVTQLGYGVVVGAPITVGGEVWGVLTAGSADPERLPPGSEERLSVFAGLCAVAVASSATLAQLESQSAEQEALLLVAREVLEGSSWDPVVTTIAREAAALLGLTSAAVLRYDGDSTEVLADWHAGAGALDRDDVAGLVRTTHAVVSVGDPDTTAADDSRLALGHPVGWGAPIQIEGSTWGALVVGGERGVPVPSDAGERLERFANLSGLAVARLEARDALRAEVVEKEQFAALVELSDDFIAVAALDGRCLYLNPGGRRLVGLETLEEAQSHAVADFLTPEGLASSIEIEQPAVIEHGSWQGESTLRHFGTAESIPVSINSFLVTHPESGTPLFLATVQRDLRERKAAEQKLSERAEEVEELAAARRFLLVEALRAEERMRRQIGDALHDDVLQELYAASQDLAEVEAEDEALHRARVAVEAASRQLRDAVRDLHPAVSWTRDLEARLRSILEQGAERGGFACQLEYAASAPGDVDDLVIALVRELVQNVIKHADATYVTVSVRDSGPALVVEVADDGRGMPDERPLEALRGGHIGLASARERVEAIGGRFELDSSPAGGTRVRVEIPRGQLGESVAPPALR